VLLYLGRIHPKKGILNLLQAIALLRHTDPGPLENWRVVIAGWAQNGHEAEMKQFVQAHNLSRCVEFIGPQFGSAKSATLHHADAFILPSFSEGLPMAVLEACAHRLPVLMTPECNLGPAYAAGAALRIEANPESIAEGLNGLFALDDMQRIEIGEQARRFVAGHYQWSTVAQAMREVYAWMTGTGPKPAHVHTVPEVAP
jgi:poly(glycerol-phosphate) alpha-glucosyltransferase